MEYQNFKLEIDEQGIAVFTANRPEKMNALNDLSWAEMNQFFTWADKADEVKVIIVTGAGKHRMVICIGDEEEIFFSCREAERLYNLPPNSVGKVCRGELESIYGYRFGYL